MDGIFSGGLFLEIVEDAEKVVPVEVEIQIVRHRDIVQGVGDVLVYVDAFDVLVRAGLQEGNHRQVFPAVEFLAVGILQLDPPFAEVLAGDEVFFPVVGVSVQAHQDAVEVESLA